MSENAVVVDNDTTAVKKRRTESGTRKEHVITESAKKYNNVIADLWDWDSKTKMFHNPVSDAEVPGYSSVIKHPIALSDIKRRIEKGKYTTDEKFENDLIRMIGNALEFNQEGSSYHKHALRMKKHLKKVFEKHGVAPDQSGGGGSAISTDDVGDEVYVPTRQAVDNCSSFNKEMKKNREDITTLLSKMEEDMDIPVEQLRARYAQKHTGNNDNENDNGSKNNEGKETTAKTEEEKEARHREQSSDDEGSSSSSDDSDGEDDSSSSGEEDEEGSFEDSTAPPSNTAP